MIRQVPIPSLGRLLALCALGLAAAARAQAPTSPAVDGWYDLGVPGGVSALLAEAGLDPTLPRTRAVREVVRVVHSLPSGREPALVDQQQRVAAYLRSVAASGPPSPSRPSDEVPLPLSPATWRALLRPREELKGSLATALLGDRRASLLYLGLLACDAPTRAFFDTQLDLLRGIVGSDRVAVFAGASTGIRVSEHLVVTPGGPDARPLWEALVGEPADRPDRFILKLLGKDGGRLALLYDAVAQLDPPRQAFVLGPASSDPGVRRDHLERVYRAAKALTEASPLTVRPFGRNWYDVPHILALMPVDNMGGLTGPAWRLLWRKAFESEDIPVNPAGDLAKLDEEGRLDAAGLLELLVQAGSSIALKTDRVQSLALALRVFEHASREALPDVLVTVRSFRRFRALVSTLDRLDVTDPAVFAAAVRQADRLSQLGGRERSTVALGLFQGSLALIEHARLARTLDAAGASRLVQSLSDLPMSEGGEYLGATGAWMTGTLLPALPARLAPPDVRLAAPVEQAILAAFAGRPLSVADSPNLDLSFEGQVYRVDLVRARQLRLQAVRGRQRAVSPDAALALGRAAAALADPRTPVDRIPTLTVAIDEASQNIARAVEASRGAWLDVKGFRQVVAEAVADARQISRAEEVQKLARLVLPLRRVADAILANATMSLAYAAFLTDPAGFELLDGDPAGRHDWGLGGTVHDPRSPAPWTLAEDSRTPGGWCLRGALLGADVARATLVLRRVASDGVPQAPSVSENNIRALAESIVLGVPFDHSDADRETVVDALRRGRQRFGAARASPSGWQAAANAMGVTDYRRGLLAWTLTREPDRAEHLVTLGELVRLGSPEGSGGRVLDAWGTSGLAFDGRWGLRYPWLSASEPLAGRPGSALTAAGVPDLVLALADVMHERKLPAVLTRDVLACATQDLIDVAHLQHEDDWLSLSAYARTVPERLDEYLAMLTAGGPLVPAPRK